jgi:long-chain fatty acid transport protein
LFGATALVFSLPRLAHATDVLEFPDNGTEQMARGGAWVARAANPLAALYNPAGLAGQQSGVLADLTLVLNKTCFQRSGKNGKLDVGSGLAYPEVCNSNQGTPQPLPSVAVVFRATDRLGLGLSVTPPSVYGALEFPVTQKIKNAVGAEPELPAGQRYLLIEQGGIALNTTLSAGFEVVPGLRVGAGFIWGFAHYRISNANMSLNPLPESDGSYRDPATSDVRADLDVTDGFIPGVTVGALYSPHETIDLGLNVIAQQAFDAHGDLTLEANYWTNNGVSDSPDVSESKDTKPGLGHFRIANPLEARLGARFHLPRKPSPRSLRVRDPLADDVFDVEVDLSYTRNSAYDRATLRFPKSPPVPVKGTANGAVVPENNDFELRTKGDSVGVRLGGDFVVLPDRLAVRAGGWLEPDVENDEYGGVAFLANRRLGLALGATYRLLPVDVEAGYMHVFFEDVDNHGNGKVLVVSGDATGTPPFRSPYGINGGRFRQSANIFSLGGTLRF